MSRTSKFRLVASGTISQNDPIFGTRKNKQCVCISVAAIVFIENVERHYFSTETIDNLVVSGDLYYNKTKQLLGPSHHHDYLNPDEVCSTLELENIKYEVETCWLDSGVYPLVTNEIDSCSEQLKNKLENVFEENPDSGFVFLGLNVAVSFWKSEEAYFLFDSHATLQNGVHGNEGVARLFRFENLFELSHFLVLRSPLDGNFWQYEITRVISRRVETTVMSNKRKLTQSSSSDEDNIPLINLIDSGENSSVSESNTKISLGDLKLNAELRVLVEDVCKITLNNSKKEESDGTSQPKRGRPQKKIRGRPKTSNMTKEEQIREAAKRYAETHPHIHRKAVEDYTQKNPDVHRNSVKIYSDKHPEVNRKAVSVYAENNPEVKIASVKKYKDSNPGLHLPKAIRTAGPIAEYSGRELDKILPYRLKNPSLRSPNTQKCPHCGARLFDEEVGRKSWCCSGGRNKVISFPPLTDPLYNDRVFLQHPRLYNDLFSFCALQIPLGYHHKKGLSFLKILGRTYHLVFDGNCGGTNNSFLYFDDGNARIAEGEKKKLSPLMIKKIQKYLESCNPYVHLYKKLHDEPAENARLEFETTSRRTHGPALGDRPTSTEVSAILNCDDSEPPKGKFCIWKKGSPQPRIIDANHFLIEPFQYPLLYPQGQPGWHIGMTDNATPPRKISLLKYTRCLLLSEDRFSRFGPLSETWVIDQYARIEAQRLDYYKFMQKKAREQGGLRTGPMDEVMAAVPNEIRNDETVQGEGNVIPGRVYLPQTFTGGPRYFKVSYLNAMTIVSRLGGPTYFLTFTAYGGWEEIKLSKHPSSTHEPHLCNRVFQLKLKELMRDIQSGAFFGKISYIVWVIEFQMRGLPHAHICFRMADGGPKQNTHIDRIIRADIPNENEAGGRLRKLVLQHMKHGPCGVNHRTDLPCWDKEQQKCTKYFPKPHTETTYTDEKGFVHYKRNAENKALVKFGKDMIEVDDRWIVPYNAALLLKFECHANLEIASARKVVKYLFKYISKGSPLRRVTVVREDEEIDEVEDYVTKRYIGATDAAWRILEFDLTGRDPTVILLPVHLKGKHNVVFRPGQEQEACDKSTSLLMLYFDRPNIEELDQLTYLDFYERYRVHGSKPNSSLNPVACSDGKHYVTRRQRGECVARMFWVAPNRGEQYYLRMLLMRYPCRSYEDLYALGGPGCKTFQQAARELGLADDKKEYYDALEEAAKFMKADQLRQFFVLLSTIGCPVPEMWEKFKRDLCEDFLEVYLEDEEKAFKLGLIHIDRALRRHGSSLLEAGLPVVEDDSTELGREKLMYSSSVAKAFVDEWEPRLSLDQVGVLEYVKRLINGQCDKKVIFLDGPGGSGKTLLLKVVSAFVRSQDKVVLCVASSGIAAQNLTGGTTAHSLFRLPLEVHDDSMWSITNGTQRAELIREASVLIYDEAPMAHKRLIETLDRSLRDLMQNDLLFGGKIVILAGDFRQIPPVVQNARSNSDIVRASVRTSYIWPRVEVFRLVTSHRLIAGDDYGEFLMQIGSDTTEKRYVIEGRNVEKLVCLPQLSFVTQTKELIDSVFPGEILQKPDECSKRVIICTLNENVNEINDIVLSSLEGQVHNLYSYDSVAEDEVGAADTDEALLHQAQGKGVPNHLLRLKVGCVCIVTRNLSFGLGLVNGTKVIVMAITRKLITCRKPDSDVLLCIPRITFKFPIFSKSPIEMYRRQFPLQLSYAITIHKSQGQTIEFVGLDLRSDPFTHGQLYVALSRVRSPNDIRLLVNPTRVIDGRPYTKNVVFKELL